MRIKVDIDIKETYLDKVRLVFLIPWCDQTMDFPPKTNLTRASELEWGRTIREVVWDSLSPRHRKVHTTWTDVFYLVYSD